VDSGVTVQPLSLTVPVTGTQSYGGTPTFTAGPPASLPTGLTGVTGTLTGCTTSVGATTVPGSYPTTITGCGGLTPTGSGAADYAVTYADAGYTVTPAPIAVAVTGSQPFGGTTTFADQPPALLPSGISITGSLSGCASTATTATPVGSYPGSISGCGGLALAGLDAGDYALTYDEGATTVTPLSLPVTVTGTQTYGGSPTFAFSAASPLPAGISGITDTLTGCTTSVTAAAHVGSSAGTVSGCTGLAPTGPDAGDYAVTYTGGSFTVTPATLAIVPAGQSGTYGATPPAFTYAVHGLENGDSQATALPTAPTCAPGSTAPGLETISCTGGTTSPDYVLDESATATYLVAQAPLTITADNQTSIYGQALPTLTAPYAGLVNGDTPASLTTSPTCTTTATSASAAGTYPITCSGAVDPNYAITYAAGTLTIGAAPLTISADNQASTYGQALPTLTASYSGLVNGDTPASLTTSPTCTTTATSASPSGTYPISCSGAVDPNYAITYAAGTLTIGAAPLTVTADDQSVAFGAAEPTPTFTVAGTENGDSQSTALPTAPTCSVTVPHTAVGTYPITCSGGVADADYTVTYVAGTLTVTGLLLPVTVTGTLTSAGIATFAYAQPAAPPAGITGVSGTLSGCTTSASPSTPGSFPDTIAGCTGLVATGPNATDYTVTYTDGGTLVLPAPVVVPATQRSYWTVAADGGVFAYGSAQFYGSMGGRSLASPVVGIAATGDGHGYWLVAADGGVFAFGDAGFHGSMGGTALSAPIVSITATPDGGGYWLVAADGGVFAFGDAGFYGSSGGAGGSTPIAGMASTPDGHGYWLVAANGGVFAFGDATYSGSMASRDLNAPVVGIAGTGDGHGYWLDAPDGGVFAFGDAGFGGSMGGTALVRPMVGLASTADGGGYWLVAADGGVFAFGDAGFSGSIGGHPLVEPMVGIAALPAG